MSCYYGRFTAAFLIVVLAMSVQRSLAGVINPDISAIGQMRVYMTDDSTDPNHDRGQFSFDETELVFDAYLNPYAHGTFVFAISEEEGIAVEEGYFQIQRGLPKGIALKAGKYRVGFGKLNPMHDHAYPFIERFHVLAAYLPGDESYNEIGGQLSYLLPLPGTLASTLSADILQGNSFKVLGDGEEPEAESRPAILGRWSNFFSIGGESSMEIGVSATQGTNSVANSTTTTVIGADVKAKIWTNPQDNLVLQAEYLSLNREYMVTDDEGNSTTDKFTPSGGYFFANYTMKKRYNAGVKFESFQEPTAEKPTTQGYGVFLGTSLMEETTLFRFVYDRYSPDEGQAFNTYTVQALFSMGPHKAHQF